MKPFLSFFSVSLISITLMTFAAMPARGGGDNDPQTPYIQTVNPEDAKGGSVITAVGTALGKSMVSEIYLTKGNVDVKLEITTQKTDQIIAKIPTTVEAGRYRLMVLTTGLSPRFIEQPVQLTVE